MYIVKHCEQAGVTKLVVVKSEYYVHVQDDELLNLIQSYCTLRGRIEGAASAVSIIQHGLRGGARNTARHVITVTVLAFPYTRNKAGKMQSTINQLKHGRDVLYVQ